MSEAKISNRIVLGPVARKLIEGHAENRPQALDDAILALQDAPQAAPETSHEEPHLEGRIQSLETLIERQSEAIKQLSYATTLQHKMTRILIASLMSETNEEQQTLVGMAEQAAGEAQAKTDLLGESEIEMLQREEASVNAAIQREFERTGIEAEPALDEELER